MRVQAEPLGLRRATKSHIPWKDEEDEARRLLDILSGEEGPATDLILYNAALRLWISDEDTPLAEHVEEARAVLTLGRALEIADRLRARVAASG